MSLSGDDGLFRFRAPPANLLPTLNPDITAKNIAPEP